MAAKRVTTVRKLRGSFPKVKRVVEAEGAVIVSDHGKSKYLLTQAVGMKTLSSA